MKGNLHVHLIGIGKKKQDTFERLFIINMLQILLENTLRAQGHSINEIVEMEIQIGAFF